MKYNLDQLPYRKGVYAIILNSDRSQVLLVHKVNSNVWDLPGGGVDEGESLEEAVLRELEEELHTTKFDILHQSSNKYRYDWPETEIDKNLAKKGKLMRGQEQTFFVLAFTGEDAQIHLQQEELKGFKWIPVAQLGDYIVYPSMLDYLQSTLSECNI